MDHDPDGEVISVIRTIEYVGTRRRVIGVLAKSISKDGQDFGGIVIREISQVFGPAPASPPDATEDADADR